MVVTEPIVVAVLGLLVLVVDGALVEVALGTVVVGADEGAASKVLVTLTVIVVAGGTDALTGGLVGNTTTIDALRFCLARRSRESRRRAQS